MVRLPYLILLWVLKDHAGCKSDVSAIRLTKDYVFLRKLVRSNGTASLPAHAALSEVRSGESARLPPMCPGFDSRTRRQMWVEFVVGSRLCSEGFSPGSPVFLPPQKSTLLNSNSIWKQCMKSHFVEMPLQIPIIIIYHNSDAYA